jgi:NAD(P)H-dependent FMN reductase
MPRDANDRPDPTDGGGMPLLQVIVASTRPGRVGRSVGDWFAAEAVAHGAFDVELVDLAEVDLPLLDEPHHPRLADYIHDHTRQWSDTIARADAYAFVMPEYNHSFSAPLKNAIDFLWNEWNDKVAILLGYGGVSGGIRGMQSFKPVLEAVRLHLAAEIPVPFVHKQVVDGVFTPAPPTAEGAAVALTDAARLQTALSSLRVAAVR